MTAEELKDLVEDGRMDRLKESDIDVSKDGRLVVQNRIALPVQVDSSTPKSDDLEVRDENNLLGVLCLTTRYDSVDLRILSDWQLVAYVTEIPKEEYELPYRFKSDYLILEIDHYEGYRNQYLESSPIWGGFVHSDASLKTVIAPHNTNMLVTKRDIFVPTSYHKAALRRAIEASHPYDRFLKLYHQLELLFDWTVVRRIQKMEEDISKLGKLISGYKADDLHRLKELLHTYCENVDLIADKLVESVNYEQVAYDMFQKFDKTGNPLSQEDRWDSFWEMMQQGGCSFERAKTKRGLPGKEPKYKELVLDVAAYWIFRIRCSIAHARIGEYILTETDQEFVVNFGEPLLKCVLSELLTSVELRALC